MKSKQCRLKMLDDINSNRYRVQSILTWLQDADISNIREQLVRKHMNEQSQKLIELENLRLLKKQKLDKV